GFIIQWRIGWDHLELHAAKNEILAIRNSSLTLKEREKAGRIQQATVLRKHNEEVRINGVDRGPVIFHSSIARQRVPWKQPLLNGEIEQLDHFQHRFGKTFIQHRRTSHPVRGGGQCELMAERKLCGSD